MKEIFIVLKTKVTLKLAALPGDHILKEEMTKKVQSNLQKTSRENLNFEVTTLTMMIKMIFNIIINLYTNLIYSF